MGHNRFKILHFDDEYSFFRDADVILIELIKYSHI